MHQLDGDKVLDLAIPAGSSVSPTPCGGRVVDAMFHHAEAGIGRSPCLRKKEEKGKTKGEENAKRTKKWTRQGIGLQLARIFPLSRGGFSVSRGWAPKVRLVVVSLYIESVETSLFSPWEKSDVSHQVT